MPYSFFKSSFRKSGSLKLALVALATLLLFGCETPGQLSSQDPDKALMLEEARNALAQAQKSLSPAREIHQLSAARFFAEGGEPNRAMAVLESLNADRLPLDTFADYSLLYSTLALEDDSFFLAQKLINHPRLELDWRKLSPLQQQQWLKMRADLFALLGEEQKSIENYVLLAAVSDEPEQRQEAHERIWFLLSYLPHNRLERLAAEARNPVLNGWYKLALLSRDSNSDIRQLQQALNDWRNSWPEHPANTALPQGLVVISQLSSRQPNKVALLLPSSGRLQEAGDAIQKGFLTAWYDLLERYGESGEVAFYDTSNQEDILPLYERAVAEGAEIIIGPLDKAKAQQLSAINPLPVPTLALNYLNQEEEMVIPENLFQLGLSVTDEAQQIASRAWLEGQRHVLAVTPQTKWAAQALAAFQEEWEARGGIIEVTDTYPSNLNDFSPLLEQPLHIEYSNQRKQRLQRLLGKSLNTTPRRRQDLDMIFLVAYPQHARQIKPTLDFLFASGLPIYATSHIYNGIPDAGRNRDLDGIKFSAMPWVLPGALSDNLKPDTAIPPSYRQLFALGLDAFQLHQWLTQIEQLPGARLFGSTGTLSLNNQRMIHREQPWGVFRAGKVEAAPLAITE